MMPTLKMVKVADGLKVARYETGYRLYFNHNGLAAVIDTIHSENGHVKEVLDGWIKGQLDKKGGPDADR